MSSSNIKEILIILIYASIILPGEGGNVQDDPSDDPGKAKSFILSNQKSFNDVFFVGTIATAIEGEMSKQASTGKYECDNFL